MSLKKMLFFVLLLFPILVAAAEDEGEVVAIAEKYYKTVTILNNSEVMRAANLGEMSSITTEITKFEYDSAQVEESSNNNIRSNVISETTETTYKKLTTTISQYADLYLYKSVLTWKNIPSTRSYDIMGIGFYASVKVFGSIYLKQDYCTSDDSCFESTSFYNEVGDNGAGAMFYLPSGSLSSLKQTLEVEVEKTNSSSTIVTQVAVGDYSHATSSISYSNAKKFYVDVGGINLDSSIEGYYDSISAARATWTGTW